MKSDEPDQTSEGGAPETSLPDSTVGGPTNSPAEVYAPPESPTKIGPYHILGWLARGGMGEVYKAERRVPYRQLVALKLIKLGFDSREVIGRFSAERQALARMDHPGIAKMLDAGVSDSGRPFFVMEYVPGMPIARFADENKLTLEDRLKLFQQVCAAIGHAHIKQLIHRDIKTANILAYLKDGKPTVKVIDFGIAKALTNERLTDNTFNTVSGQVIGTYGSMSPEQAGVAQDLDTRTDIYSLGVVLYELLVGAEPFDAKTLASATEEELRRMIREQEPPKPSTRLGSLGDAATAAAKRQTTLAELQWTLRKELEWIPLKAMRKERDRRYSSAQQLSEDIDNFLNNRPLIAAPESRIYRLRKHARRNLAALIATTAVALALISGIAGTTAGFVGQRRLRLDAEHSAAAALSAQRVAQQQQELAEQQQKLAEQQQKKAEDAEAASGQVNKFLTDMLGSVDPNRAQGKPVLVRDVLKSAADNVDSHFRDQPLVAASLHQTIGQTYGALGLYSDAIAQLKQAMATRRGILGPDNLDTVEVTISLANILTRDQRLPEADPLCRQTLSVCRAKLGDDAPLTFTSMENLSRVLWYEGKVEEAEPLLRELVARYRHVFGPDDPRTLAETADGLVPFLKDQGKLAESESLIRDVIARRGGEAKDTESSDRFELAGVLLREYRTGEAEPILRDTAARAVAFWGPEHPYALTNSEMLAEALDGNDKFVEAESIYRQVLAHQRQALGEGHPSVCETEANLAQCLEDEGKFSDAETVARAAAAGYIRLWTDQSPPAIQANETLAESLMGENELKKADPICHEVLAKSRLSIQLSQYHPVMTRAISDLAQLDREEGDLAVATLLSREVYRRVRKATPFQFSPRMAARLAADYGLCLAAAGRHQDAEAPFLKARQLLMDGGLATDQEMITVTRALVGGAQAMGHWADVAKWHAELAGTAATRP